MEGGEEMLGFGMREGGRNKTPLSVHTITSCLREHQRLQNPDLSAPHGFSGSGAAHPSAGEKRDGNPGCEGG